MPPHIDHPGSSHTEISRVVVPRERIARRVEQLGQEITEFYQGREVTLMMVLTGALVFVSDLIHQLALPVRIEPVSVGSYPGARTQPQASRFRLPPPENLEGRHVLIVDDIYDSGQTMAVLTEAVRAARAASVRGCVLLRKDRPDLETRPGEVHFVGMDIPDVFVVGYGLDFDDLYRNLPDICVLKAHAQEERT